MVGSVMVPTLDASNDTILAGDTPIFLSIIGNAVNWSLEYTYSINGDTFTDLLLRSGLVRATGNGWRP